LIALDAGAEDIKSEDDSYEIITEPQHFESVRDAIQEAGIETTLEEISMIPQTTVKLDGKEALQLLKIIGSLEDHDDVQNVYSNFDIPDDLIEQAA
jgi:transcriptional/translational regulatory protein YebC/TACO1